MDYPCIKINLSKVERNIKLINDRCVHAGISVVGVSKCVLGDGKIAQAFIRQGIEIIGDSRLKNLKKLRSSMEPGQKLLLLRTPMLSEISEMLDICFASMNTQRKTVKEISRVCLKRNMTHNIIIMVETDDRREGLLPGEVLAFAGYVISECPGVSIWGIGTNARCISKRKPSVGSARLLLKLKEKIENKFSISIPVVSGGNSSIISLIESGQIPAGINQARIGEAILLGHETSDYRPIEGAYRDAFILDAEIIEVRQKNGKICKIIVGLGIQDASYKNLQLVTKGLEFADQSSDHTVLFSVSDIKFEVGDIISFQPDYFGLLSCMTSPFVRKLYQE